MLSRLPGGMQICYYDAAFTTKWISDGLCRMLGYGCADEYAADTGNCCRGFIQAEDYGPMCAQVDEAFRRGNAYTAEYRVRRRDGSVFWVQDLGRRVRDEDGEEVVYCFISDITQRKDCLLYTSRRRLHLPPRRRGGPGRRGREGERGPQDL